MFTKSQKFLESKAGQLNRQTQVDISNAQLKLYDADMYIRTDISGAAGIVELIDETTEKRAGTTNFNANKLPKSVNMVVEALRAGYGTTTDVSGITDPALVKYSNGYGAVPAALANAELVISLNDKPVLEIPVQRLLAEDANTRTIGTEDAYNLGALQLIKEEEPVSIALRFPKGVSMPAVDNYFFELHLIGAKTGQR